MNKAQLLIFIHGLEGSSQGFKATHLRSLFPHILTPDLRGSLEERMAQLEEILAAQSGWIIIGSSFGGLMAALFACHQPQQVKKLILLAPALIWPDFAQSPPAPVSVPTIIYHGSRDELIPPRIVEKLARQVFLNLTFKLVEDEHDLHQTVLSLDWQGLVS